MNNTIFFIVQGVMLLFVMASTAFLILNNKKIKSYKAMYDKALSNFDNSDIPNAEFNNIYERLNMLEGNNLKKDKIISEMRANNERNIQKIGLVKYNAYEEGNSRLSFALALTDAHFCGIMFNLVYSKHGSNLYLKEIREGKIEGRIADEEKQALEKLYCEKDSIEKTMSKISKRGKKIENTRKN